ncbi:MAG: toll/interleukin-1 receptor domain-containing protein [Phyllobacteriaceae bacterium]|jgi:hypothetical protein|nr:toll/interleukin-1 receptor domain-containing protein [Phyllobacteriaceae bacterium]
MVDSGTDGRLLDETRVYIAWHPDFEQGRGIAERLIADLTLSSMSTGAVPIPTEIRSAPAIDSACPRSIDPKAARFSVVVIISDTKLVQAMGSDWQPLKESIVAAMPDLVAEVGPSFVLPLVFAMDGPGSLDPLEPDPGSPQAVAWDAPQAVRAYDWEEPEEHRAIKRALFVMRTLLIGLQLSSNSATDSADRHLVFVSHAKADKHQAEAAGMTAIVEALRRRMADSDLALDPYFDETHLTPSLGWRQQFQRAIARSSFIALRTDTYGSRPVCQWELLLAKRRRRPVICIEALTKRELISFAYGANLPTLRLNVDPDGHAIDILLLALMSETVRCLLWLREARRVAVDAGMEDVTLLPRPAELLDLAFHVLERKTASGYLVYPDPPLPRDTVELLDALRPEGVEVLPLSALRFAS